MPTRKGWGVASGLMLMLLSVATGASAQFASSIEGTISDSTGAIVPGASVTIANEATGTTQTVTTTGAGYYRFPALPGSTYTVRVSLSGFKTAVQEHILLQAAEIKTVNIVLESGQVKEEVTVTGKAPLIETAEGRVSGLIETRQIESLPLMGRNFYSLVILTPGVVGRATGGGQAYAQSNSDLYNNEFGVNMNANGARAESNNFLVDSSTVSSSQRSGVVNINPNSESVQEVRIAVNNFSAENGRNGSILVNVITKSGTNALNASVGTYYTNNTLQSKNYFQKQAAAFSHPDYGRTELSWGVGGPVRKDGTFFFTSGDVLRSDVAVSGARTILTPEYIRFMEQARPSNFSTNMAKNFPASFAPGSQLPHGGPASERRVLGLDADQLTDRRRALQPAGHGRRHVERNLPAQWFPVDGPGRPSPAWRPGPDLRFVQSDDDGQGGLRNAGGLPGLHGIVADEQHALQYELDPHHLADRPQRSVVRLGEAVG